MPTQLNAPVPQINPVHKGGIKKGDPKYDEILKKAVQATDYGIGELMYKHGASAKKFIEEIGRASCRERVYVLV